MTISHPTIHSQPAARRGFTLPDLMVSLALIVMVAGGMMAAYVFGMRMYVMSDVKLDASNDVRELGYAMGEDIRSAADFDIGTGSATSFTPVTTAQPRQGNAIQIYPTSSTNVWIRYYVDLTTQQLCEVDNEDTNVSFMASSITNKVPFTAEDFAGNITSNEQPKEVIGVLLQIDQVLVKRKSKTQTANGQTSDVKPDLTDYFEFRTRFNKRNDLGYQR